MPGANQVHLTSHYKRLRLEFNTGSRTSSGLIFNKIRFNLLVLFALFID